jgi:hypothetical protein
MKLRLGGVYRTNCGDLIKVTRRATTELFTKNGYVYEFDPVTSLSHQLKTRYLTNAGRYDLYVNNHPYNVVCEVDETSGYWLEE